MLAASSIKLHRMLVTPAMLSSLQLYLSNQGECVHGIELHNLLASNGHYPILQQLPHGKLQKLNSLSVKWLRLQLQPGGGFQGVLAARAPLKQLELQCCELLDNEGGLSAALSLLPDLQHLSLVVNSRPNRHWGFPSNALLGLLQLTYFELRQGLQHAALQMASGSCRALHACRTCALTAGPLTCSQVQLQTWGENQKCTWRRA